MAKKLAIQYRVWELISPYDGYATTDCDSWEAALEVVKTRITARQYERFLKKECHLVLDSKEHTYSEIFITTAPLSGPVE